ncbi:hypothetical protein GJ700_12315 [Duganella sp. FT92W]|uniref:Uncharacterized protein n=1 Tax=Pseudoduganella rivuli TaxID=2666085 RepID=A0A7X2IMI5_9BURK|nr:hypothetical protein [Pseudoduganella rivuli]MRV72493.1 hypothetical protein [Pseudoduganella rivuli]
MPVYAHQATLEAIPDLFCAEAIWQAPGFALFSRRPLLRDLLERSPREQRGRAATRCFAHVIVTLPQEDIDDDYHLARGARARELEQALAALHQRDFADLLGGDAVRYLVQGSDDVPPGAVSVRFGHAVYLPAQGEKIAFSASVSRDGVTWKPVCPVYAGQRLALLGTDAGWAVCPGEPPPAPGGAILLLNDGPGAQPIVQARPRDAFECRFDAAHGHYAVRPRAGMAAGQGADGQLLLRVSVPAAAHRMADTPASGHADGRDNAAGNGIASPAATPAAVATVTAQDAATGPARSAPERGHAVWQPRPAADQPDGALARQVPTWQAAADATALPQPVSPAAPRAAAAVAEASDATYVPMARQRVTLAALALPRLSRYRETGARRLDIPLGPLGEGPEHGVALAIDADDALHAVTPGGHQAVTAPATLQQPGGRAIHVLAPPAAMADRYCALLPLSQQASVQLPLAGRHRFGRQAPALAPLRLLDSPRLLHCGGTQASADRIGLSREAFSFEMSPQGVRIARLAASQALYHLDGQLQFVASIGAASAEAPYLLPPGHHVAAGHYVLRFDA